MHTTPASASSTTVVLAIFLAYRAGITTASFNQEGAEHPSISAFSFFVITTSLTDGLPLCIRWLKATQKPATAFRNIHSLSWRGIGLGAGNGEKSWPTFGIFLFLLSVDDGL